MPTRLLTDANAASGSFGEQGQQVFFAEDRLEDVCLDGSRASSVDNLVKVVGFHASKIGKKWLNDVNTTCSFII